MASCKPFRAGRGQLLISLPTHTIHLLSILSLSLILTWSCSRNSQSNGRMIIIFIEPQPINDSHKTQRKKINYQISTSTRLLVSHMRWLYILHFYCDIKKQLTLKVHCKIVVWAFIFYDLAWHLLEPLAWWCSSHNQSLLLFNPRAASAIHIQASLSAHRGSYSKWIVARSSSAKISVASRDVYRQQVLYVSFGRGDCMVSVNPSIAKAN